MSNPNYGVAFELGINMNKFLFRLAFADAALLPASFVLAADLNAPPPVKDLRPATFDWAGPSLGIFGAVMLA